MVSSRLLSFLHPFLFVAFLPLAAHGYFQVTYPTSGAQVANGQTIPVTWTKGLLDGVDFFDLELTRMSTDGLILVARSISSSSRGVNLAMTNVPTGNDYSLLFINSTHGALYAASPLFSIVGSGSTNSTQSPLASQPTVTISGGPNPTAQFITTFPANGVPHWRPSRAALLSTSLMCLALLTGAAVVL